MIKTGIAAQYDLANPEQHRALFKRLSGWGIPPREIDLVLTGLRDTTSLAFVKDWLRSADAAQGPTMLVMAGPKGVGKTIAAIYAMMHSDPWLPHGDKWKPDQIPRFRHVSDVAEVKLFGDEEDRKKRHEIKSSQMLVVDDVGVEFMSEMFLALFDSIVNARYGSMGRTILTTNLTADQFSTRYGSRVYDRIKGRGDWYDIDEESMRGREPT